MKKKYILLTVTAVSLLVSGCGSKWLDENPTTEMTADKLYAEESGFEAGLNGLYALVRGEREGYGYTDSFGATGLRALMYIGGTDNYNCGAGASGEFSAIYKNWATANVATDKSLKNVFSWLYNAVLTANTIIDRAENPDVSWSGNKERIVGEARLIRAWAYRHLTYLWGDVPLVIHEVTGDTFRTDYTREDVSVIREQIIADLKYAVKYVPWMPSSVGRATKGVALTWLSEMYLAEAGTGDSGWDLEKVELARHYADTCIQYGPYRLIKNRLSSDPGCAFMDMFKPEYVNIESGNTEAMWVMQWDRASTGGGNNLMRFSLRPKFDTSERIADGVNISYMDESRGGRGFARTSLTKWALELYDKSSDRAAGIVDDRGSEYAIAKYYVIGPYDEVADDAINASTGVKYAEGDIVYIGCEKVAEAGLYEKSCMESFAGLKSGEKEGDNNNWPYTLKYSYCDPGYPKNNESHDDQVFMRVAETYLLRAEALYKLGRTDEAAADINELRSRANALTVSAGDITMTVILEERSRELLGEEQRRYTLQRTMEPTEFVDWITSRNGKDQGMTERDYLFPIPQDVIDANVSLPMEQNPGFN